MRAASASAFVALVAAAFLVAPSHCGGSTAAHAGAAGGPDIEEKRWDAAAGMARALEAMRWFEHHLSLNETTAHPHPSHWRVKRRSDLAAPAHVIAHGASKTVALSKIKTDGKVSGVGSTLLRPATSVDFLLLPVAPGGSCPCADALEIHTHQ